jgi:hypothetical protein
LIGNKRSIAGAGKSSEPAIVVALFQARPALPPRPFPLPDIEKVVVGGMGSAVGVDRGHSPGTVFASAGAATLVSTEALLGHPSDVADCVSDEAGYTWSVADCLALEAAYT